MKHQNSCDDHPKHVKGCAGCTARTRVYSKRRRLAASRGERFSVAVDISRDRVRQLMAAGWRTADIERISGLSDLTIWRVANTDLQWTQLKVFHGIEKAWRELSLFPGPSPITAARSKAKGWTPPPTLPLPSDFETFGSPQRPLIVDEVVVERLIQGERVEGANKYERIEAVRTLHGKGWTVPQIAAQLRMNQSRAAQVVASLGERASA